MALALDLIEIIKSVYFEILKKKHPDKMKEIDIDYSKIAREIMSVIAIENAKGSYILDVASNIMFMLLKKNFFKYENCEVAALIIYLYLKKGGNTVGKYSMENFNGDSTLDDIKVLIKKWF